MIRCEESIPQSKRKLWRKVSWILVVAATFSAASATGQGVIWIGRPTIADYMGYNLGKGIASFVELRQEMARFGAEIEEARRAYFAAHPSNRAAAGDKFGELLFQKDVLIAMGRVSVANQKDDLVSPLMALANGGRPPDGGVPPVARQAFNRWVSALRMSAGSGFGGMPAPAQFAIAIKNSGSLKEYEEYRRLRDQAEWDEYEAMRNGGVRKLLAPGVLVSPKSYFGESVMAQGFDGRIARLSNKILQCEYAGGRWRVPYFTSGTTRPRKKSAC